MISLHRDDGVSTGTDAALRARFCLRVLLDLGLLPNFVSTSRLHLVLSCASSSISSKARIQAAERP